MLELKLVRHGAREMQGRNGEYGFKVLGWDSKSDSKDVRGGTGSPIFHCPDIDASHTHTMECIKTGLQLRPIAQKAAQAIEAVEAVAEVKEVKEVKDAAGAVTTTAVAAVAAVAAVPAVAAVAEKLGDSPLMTIEKWIATHEARLKEPKVKKMELPKKTVKVDGKPQEVEDASVTL